eukprot:gb/GEZJ01000927.1/.p1 GENE.gb/GEZJ01000927.1/~~gb/GEZJ01000927.1/.p1  ORF type:complete len:319 (-),score=-12.11 gb/GEZJ01000927.1/:567-1523(-)
MTLHIIFFLLVAVALCSAQSSHCPPGTFVTVELDSRVCTPCPPNTFSDRIDSRACRQCSQNSVPNQAQTTCFCNAGFLFNVSTLACSPCPSGTFRETLNMAFKTSCRSCPANSVPNPARTLCVCNAGLFFNTSTSLCSPCPAGTFRDGYDPRFQTSCIPCPANSISDETRSTCLCNPGLFIRYRPFSCVPCPPGTSRAGFSRRHLRFCSPCGAFEFQPSAGSASCIPCGENGYSNRDRLSCFFCKPGETVIATGLCGICPPGATTNTSNFQLELSLLRGPVCKPCQPGLFKPEAGQQICEACPEGFSSNRGGTSCFPL